MEKVPDPPPICRRRPCVFRPPSGLPGAVRRFTGEEGAGPYGVGSPAGNAFSRLPSSGGPAGGAGERAGLSQERGSGGAVAKEPAPFPVVPRAYSSNLQGVPTRRPETACEVAVDGGPARPEQEPPLPSRSPAEGPSVPPGRRFGPGVVRVGMKMHVGAVPIA